jgi:membrane-associated phospholipid phosphatase
VLAGYLAVTAPAALLAGTEPGAHLGWLAAAHLTGLAFSVVVAWAPWSAPRWSDWAPLVVMTILYGELPALMAGAAGGGGAVTYHDGLIQHWESGLFGTSPAVALASQLPASVSGLLHAAYLSYYVLIFLPPLLLFARKSRGQAFQTTVLALTASFALCFAVFVYFPVQGPRYSWPPPPNIPDGAIRAFALKLLRSGSSRGAAFPSSHVAVATTQAILALEYQKRVGIVTSVVAILLALGAVYAGFHYGVDVLAGAALGCVVSATVLVYARAPRELLSMSEDVTAGLTQSPAE